MPTFTYVTVSYCYVGVSYPVVGYAGEGYCGVGYCGVGYGFVGVTYSYVDEGYCEVGYDGVWCSEMWRRTHRWGLTRGVAVDRMEVQQRGKREKGTPMTKIEALKWTAEWDLATAVAKTQWFAQCGWDEARDALLAVAGRGRLGRYSAADVSCAWAKIRPSTAPAD